MPTEWWMKQVRRQMVERWLRGEVRQAEAARALGLSKRQVRRQVRRFEAQRH